MRAGANTETINGICFLEILFKTITFVYVFNSRKIFKEMKWLIKLCCFTFWVNPLFAQTNKVVINSVDQREYESNDTSCFVMLLGANSPFLTGSIGNKLEGNFGFQAGFQFFHNKRLFQLGIQAYPKLKFKEPSVMAINKDSSETLAGLQLIYGHRIADYRYLKIYAMGGLELFSYGGKEKAQKPPTTGITFTQNDTSFDGSYTVTPCFGFMFDFRSYYKNKASLKKSDWHNRHYQLQLNARPIWLIDRGTGFIFNVGFSTNLF